MLALPAYGSRLGPARPLEYGVHLGSCTGRIPACAALAWPLYGRGAGWSTVPTRGDRSMPRWVDTAFDDIDWSSSRPGSPQPTAGCSGCGEAGRWVGERLPC